MAYDRERLEDEYGTVLKRIHEAAFGRREDKHIGRDISLLGTIKRLLGIR